MEKRAQKKLSLNGMVEVKKSLKWLSYILLPGTEMKQK